MQLLRYLIPLAFVPCLALAQGQKLFQKKDRKALDPYVLDAGIWKKEMAELRTATNAPEDLKYLAEMPEDKRQAELAKGRDFERFLPGLYWQTSAKDGLYGTKEGFTFLGKPVGEVQVRGVAGKPTTVSISFYNRGDDGTLSQGAFDQKYNDWQAGLAQALAVRGEPRETRGALPVKGMIWTKGDSAYLLEGSFNRSTGQAEFLRLRIASVTASKSASVARRGSMGDRVTKEGNGDVFLEGVPMVDQGQKGYCAVATLERVIRYYGAEADQHELAQLAGSDGDGGTSISMMDKAMGRMTGKLHLRTIKLHEYDERQIEKDVKDYYRVAKKAGKPALEKVETQAEYNRFMSELDPAIFREAKEGQSGYKRFVDQVREHIDKGEPLCWAVMLGIFKEQNLPQSSGGHMRLIIGYNDKTKELIYTDSWGAGHERKKMLLSEAWGMTQFLYLTAPTR